MQYSAFFKLIWAQKAFIFLSSLCSLPDLNWAYYSQFSFNESTSASAVFWKILVYALARHPYLLESLKKLKKKNADPKLHLWVCWGQSLGTNLGIPVLWSPLRRSPRSALRDAVTLAPRFGFLFKRHPSKGSMCRKHPWGGLSANTDLE